MQRPVDLPRVRRALAQLDALMTDNPGLAERTARWCAGELPGPTLEDTLRNDPTRTAPPWLAVRIPGDLVDRAAALVPVLADRPEMRAGGNVNRAAVVRLALLYGLDRIEAEHAPKKAPRAR